MKKFGKAVWDFFVAWGEYRYKVSRQHQYRWY